MSKHSQIKTIYDETHRHLGDWFPNLPSYPGFVQRVNKVCDVFAPLVEILSAPGPILGDWLLDSQPIILSQ